jgi:hypothetical protein
VNRRAAGGEGGEEKAREGLLREAMWRWLAAEAMMKREEGEDAQGVARAVTAAAAAAAAEEGGSSRAPRAGREAVVVVVVVAVAGTGVGAGAKRAIEVALGRSRLTVWRG